MSEGRFCSKCGSPLQSGAAFCPKCGAPSGQASGVAAGTGASLSGIDSLMKDSVAQNYWIRRLVALFIDAVIVAVILIVIVVGIAIPTFAFSGTFGFFAVFAGLFSLLAGVIVFLYFIFAEVSRGATLGKHILNLKVIGPKGGNPTFVESVVRNASKIYWILLLLDVIVGLATSKNYTQKFSDKLVGTSVVG